MTQRDMFPRLLDDPLTLGDDRGGVQILHENNRIVLKRSTSRQGVFRGLHRQVEPYLQTKIIRVLSGKIIDFVTDPDDLHDPIHYSVITPQDDWVLVAAHLAHGFYAVEEVVFEYFCDGGYNEDTEESYFVAPAVMQTFELKNIHVSEKDQKGIPLERPFLARSGTPNVKELMQCLK